MAKIALLVGVSEYTPGLNALPAAVKDVEAMRDVLLHPEIGGFAESDITVLKNPNRQVMEEAIETLFTGKHKDDLVVLFFSGHGIKDDSGRLYLATNSTRKTVQGELIRSTAVPSNFVQDSMSRSRSRRQVVILDSCFSGAFAEGLSAKDDGVVDIRTQLGGEGRAVLTSSSSTQYSFEHEGSELSLYTRFLIEGIQTGAADLDEDEMVSIDELHEYASRKVREVKPEMRPEIYAMREGFKIRLTKVPPVDPILKYRREVARFINRGDISLIGRRTLEVLRTRLQLEENEAKAIEDGVLEPYRIEFRQKREQYEQVFTEAIQQNESLSDFDRAELQKLQQILGLRNEDTMPIEATVTAYLKAHQHSLKIYEQSFSDALRQEYQLSEASLLNLQKIQQQLQLTNEAVALIEAKITDEEEIYHQKLQQYKLEFRNSIQRQYPLSEIQLNELKQLNQVLNLPCEDITSIEIQITTEIENRLKNLHQYEQGFRQALEYGYPIKSETREELQRFQQILELDSEEVAEIEAQIFDEQKEQDRPSFQQQKTSNKDLYGENAELKTLKSNSSKKDENEINDSVKSYPSEARLQKTPLRTPIVIKHLPIRIFSQKNKLVSFSMLGSLVILSSALAVNQIAYHSNPFVKSAFIYAEKILANDGAFSLSISPDNKYLASAGGTGEIRIWDLITGKVLPFTIKASDFPYMIFSPDSKTLIVSNKINNFGSVIINPSNTQIWDIETGKILSTLNMSGNIAISPDGRTLAISGQNTQLWDLQSSQRLYTFDAVGYLSFSLDGKTLAIGGDNTQLWSLQTKKRLFTLESGSVSDLDFNGQTLITGSSKIKVWNPQTGELLMTFGTGSSYISRSPDGKTLIVASGNALESWEISTGKLLNSQQVITAPLRSWTLSQDGKICVVADSTLKIFRMKN